MRRRLVFAVASVVLLAAAPARADFPIPRAPDSDAPPGSAPHWLPGEHWVHAHYLPFDEATLYAVLRTSREGVWQWLRDDNRTLAQLGRSKGFDNPVALANRLVAPRARTVKPRQLVELRARALRILRQGHLSQHMIFHSLHQESGPDAARRLFGAASTTSFQALRRLDISPLQIGRTHGRSRAQMQQGLVDVLTEAAMHGIHMGDMSERQGMTLLRRQLRQVPRWLGEEHYNGPPQTVAGKPKFPFRPSFASPALAGDGSLVLYDAAMPAPPLAVKFGEVNLGGHALGSGTAFDPRDGSASARADRPCSSFNASVSTTGRFAAFEISAGNRTFAKRYGNVGIALADFQAHTLRRIAGGQDGATVTTAYDPSLSGDGNVVAFETVAADPMSPTSSPITRVGIHDVRTGRTTLVPREDAYEPDISGNGSRVVFTSFDAGRLQVFVYDVATRRTTQVSRAGGEAWAPSISDDGRVIAYAASSRPGGRSRIYVGTTAVTDGRAFVDQPALSGDGTRLAWSEVGRGRDALGRPVQQVLVRTLAGGATTTPALPSPGTSWSGQPQLNDDGSVLAFTSDNGAPVAGPGGLRVLVSRGTTEVVSPAVPPSTFDGGAAALDAGGSPVCDLRPPAW